VGDTGTQLDVVGRVDGPLLVKSLLHLPLMPLTVGNTCFAGISVTVSPTSVPAPPPLQLASGNKQFDPGLPIQGSLVAPPQPLLSRSKVYEQAVKSGKMTSLQRSSDGTLPLCSQCSGYV
jgi:hypothetical protein